MTITEHKRLVAEIPEDLQEGDEIEVYNARGEWTKEKFAIYCVPRSLGYAVGVMDQDGMIWPYARRPETAHQQHMADLDKGVKSAEAGINRHLEHLRQIPVLDRAGNDMWTAEEEIKSAEYHEAKRILAKEKKYRPWSDASEVPAPLMVRHSGWSKGVWAYAMPIEDDGTGLRFVVSDLFAGNIEQSAYELFHGWSLHDGQPCGTEEA